MKIGAWIHNTEKHEPLVDTVSNASKLGLQTIRCYDLGYAEKIAAELSDTSMSLMAGLHIDAADLVENWQSQVHLDRLTRYLELGLDIEAFCVGNELREGGDEPDKKRFTARLSYGLSRVLEIYRNELDRQNVDIPLTYAMEGIVFDRNGRFKEHLWPLVDVCDIVSMNSYPMSNEQWFGWSAFEESRRFLTEPRYRNLRFAAYEHSLRNTLEQLRSVGKPVILSETGFPSASGYEMAGEREVHPIHDREGFAQCIKEFIDIIRAADNDYDGIIKAIYFYEWMDNYYHAKIWNVEESPIHTAFGLCDAEGNPKFDLRKVF